MLRLLSLFFLVISVNTPAQTDTLRTPELHLGLGAQKFIHFGARHHVTKGFIAEADIGVAPIRNTPITYSLGLAYVTELTSNTFYSLIYSVVSTNIFKGDHSYIRLLSANIGVLSQHEKGGSYQLRVGGGIGQDNLFVRRTGGLPDYWEISYFPWANLELSVGYAF